MDIASLVRAVLAAFEDGSKLVQRIRDRRAKPGREPLPEGPTNDLLDSLTLGPMLVRGHYDHDVKRFGEQYTCGDGQAREQMKDVLINLQMKLIIALRTVMMDEMELDFDALQTASDDGRVNTGVCLGQLSQRLSSNLQAQAHYPTHRVSSYASSSTSTSAPTLPISSSLNYSTSQSTHSSGTFPSPPKTESLPDRSMSVVVRLSSPSPPPSSEPQQQEQEQEQEPEREEEPEPETEPLQEEPVELGDVSESEQPRVVEDAEVSNQPTPETNADHTLIVPVPLDQQSLDETNRDLENANRKSTHILASEDKGILLLFPQPGGHPKLATPLEQKQEEGQVASEHQDPPTQGRTHQSTGSRERFSPDDYQDEKMSPDDIHYKLNLGKQYSPSIRTIASQYSHSTIYDMYHHQQQQQPAPPPIDASVEAGRVMSSISSSSSSSSSAAPAPALAPPEAVVAKPLPQSTSTPPTTSQSSRPLYHSSPDYVRYLQENSRPPRSQPRTEPTTSTDKPRGKKILGKFHAAPQDIPYRPTARLARPVVINRAPEKDGAGDNKTSVVVVPIPTTAPPPRTGGWHVHPPSRSSSRPNHPVVVAGAVEVDAPHRHVHKTPPSPYRPPLRPLPPPPLPPSLPYVASSSGVASASVPNLSRSTMTMTRPFSPTSNPLPPLDFDLDLGIDLNLNSSSTTTTTTTTATSTRSISSTQTHSQPHMYPYSFPDPPPPPSIPPPPRPGHHSRQHSRHRSHSTTSAPAAVPPQPPPPPTSSSSTSSSSSSSSSVITTVTAVATAVPIATPIPTTIDYAPTLPTEHNLLGFCKGAFRLQIGLATKAFIPANRPVGYASMMPYWRCSKCNFQGPVHMSTIMTHGSDRGKKQQSHQHQPIWRPIKEFDPRIRTARSITNGASWDAAASGGKMNGHANGGDIPPIAIRYKWAFLAKCHVPLKGMVPFDTPQGHSGEVGSFACIFCAVEGRARGWVKDPNEMKDKDHDHGIKRGSNDSIGEVMSSSTMTMTSSSILVDDHHHPPSTTTSANNTTPKSKSKIRANISLIKIGRSSAAKNATAAVAAAAAAATTTTSASTESNEETSSIPIPPIPLSPSPSLSSSFPRPPTRPNTSNGPTGPSTWSSNPIPKSTTNKTVSMNLTPTFGNVASFMAHLDQVHRREEGWPNAEVQARFHCVVGRVAGAEVDEDGWEINLMPLEGDF